MLYRNDAAVVRIISSAERQAMNTVQKGSPQNQLQLRQELMSRKAELKIYFQQVSGADKINFPEYYQKQMEVILEKYNGPLYKRIVEESNTILKKRFICMNDDRHSWLELILHGSWGHGEDYETYELNHDTSLFFYRPAFSYKCNNLTFDESYYYRESSIDINRVRCSKCGKWFCNQCIVELSGKAFKRHRFPYICPNCISRMNLSMY